MIVSTTTLIGFAAVALAMVLTPGPNMAWCRARSANALIVLMAGAVSAFLAEWPFWALVQRWLMGTVLAGLALRMAIDTGRR